MRNIWGKLLEFASDPSVLKAVLSGKPYSMASYRLVRALRGCGCVPKEVIDIGANEGQFSRAILNEFNDVHIYAFEPLPMAGERYMRNLQSAAPGRVILHKVACGAAKSTVALHVNVFSQSSSFLQISKDHLRLYPHAREKGQMEVQVEKLDDLMNGVIFSSNVLMKIDVQGFELQVLEGAENTLGRIQHVLVETCFVPMYVGEPTFDVILTHLKAKGFRFVGPLSLVVDPVLRVPVQMDALFERCQ
jgi:FkbM family methyltransferase